MADMENPGGDSSNRPGASEPSTSEQKQIEPGSGSEPRQGQGDRPVQEYPGEGVRSHYPTDPVTGKEQRAPKGSGSDEESAGE